MKRILFTILSIVIIGLHDAKSQVNKLHISNGQIIIERLTLSEADDRKVDRLKTAQLDSLISRGWNLDEFRTRDKTLDKDKNESMKGTVFIDNEEIGSADFKVIDESMGGIQGELKPTENYKKYKGQIQELFDKKGIANVEDFNFKIVLDDNTILRPEGGIGLTDSKDFDEILVESAGLDCGVIEKIDGGR